MRRCMAMGACRTVLALPLCACVDMLVGGAVCALRRQRVCCVHRCCGGVHVRRLWGRRGVGAVHAHGVGAYGELACARPGWAWASCHGGLACAYVDTVCVSCGGVYGRLSVGRTVRLCLLVVVCSWSVDRAVVRTHCGPVPVVGSPDVCRAVLWNGSRWCCANGAVAAESKPEKS